MRKLTFDPATVSALNPRQVDIHQGVMLTHKCPAHNGKGIAWLLFSAPTYVWDNGTPIADTIVLKTGDVAHINGTMLLEFRGPIEQAQPGEEVKFGNTSCACTFRKLTDEQVAELVPDSKQFKCTLASGHLVDER